MFEILDSMIATITLVLVLSLIVQSIQQILKQILNMKSKFMERELFALFASVDYKRSFVPIKVQFEKLLAQQPRVQDLLAKISSRLHGIGNNDLSIVESLNKEDFLRLVGDLVDTNELEVMDLASASPAEKSELSSRIAFLQKARWDIEQWFDVTMKAFQDHYERRMKMWALGLSALVVVVLNANLFEIYGEFSSNKIFRESAVRLGERFASTPRDSLFFTTTSEGTAQAMVIPDSLAIKSIQTNINRIDSIIHDRSIPIYRWNTHSGTPMRIGGWCELWSMIWNALVRNLLGWCAMTLLVSLGAPFWYDVLKTVVGVKDRVRGRAANETASDNGRDGGRLTNASSSDPTPPAVG